MDLSLKKKIYFRMIRARKKDGFLPSVDFENSYLRNRDT